MSNAYETRKRAILNTSRREKKLMEKSKDTALRDLARAICLCPDLAERVQEYVSLVETCKESDIPVPEQHNRVLHTNGTVYVDGRPTQKLDIPAVSYSYGDSSVTFRPKSVMVEINTQGRRRNHYSADIPYIAAENDDIDLTEDAEIISRMASEIADAVTQFFVTENGFYTWLDDRTGVKKEKMEEEKEQEGEFSYE
jgi:hypothetical protein